MGSCGNQIFPTVKAFMNHYNTTHQFDRRICIFEGCSKEFPPGYHSKKHFQRKHNSGDGELKNIFIHINSEISGDTRTDQNNPGIEDNSFHEECISDDEIIMDEGNNEDDVMDSLPQEFENFEKNFADHVNRLGFHFMIPQSTVDVILTFFKDILVKGSQMQAKQVKKILIQENVSLNVINRVQSVINNNMTLTVIEKLSTPYKREVFMREKFKIVNPVEIILNPDEVKQGLKKESYMYVPLKDSIKHLFEDQTFIDVIEKSRCSVRQPSDNDVLEDLKDGHLYKNSEYFKLNDSYLGIFYSDGVEVCNPLGAGRGKHKLLQMYFTIGDLPKQFRSQTDTMQTAIVVQEKYVKKYGYMKIYRKDSKIYKPTLSNLVLS